MSLPPLLCMLLLPATAAAEPEWRVSGQAGVVSDYRWRGVSQTDGSPAVQAQINAEGPGGVYVTAWASNVTDWNGGSAPTQVQSPRARGLARTPARRDQALELSASVGRVFEIDGARLDLAVTRYGYPGGRPGYVEIPVLVSRSFGPATFSALASWAPPQPGTGGVSDRYVWLQAAFAPPGWRLQPRASVGREVLGSDPAKIDWSAGVLAEWGRLGISLDWVGADQGAGSALVAAIQRRF